MNKNNGCYKLSTPKGHSKKTKLGTTLNLTEKKIFQGLTSCPDNKPVALNKLIHNGDKMLKLKPSTSSSKTSAAIREIPEECSTPCIATNLKLKLKRINSTSKDLQLKKRNKVTLDSSDPSVNTPEIIKTAQESKRIPSTKRLTLSKPLKRRCSFTPPENNENSKKAVLTISAYNDNKNANEVSDDDFLSSYVLKDTESVQNLCSNEMTRIKIKTLKTCNSIEDFDLADDSLLDMLNNCVDEKNVMSGIASDSLILNDSLIGVATDSELINSSSEPSCLLVWVVTDIRTSSYLHNSGYNTFEKIVTLHIKEKNLVSTCHLRDDWSRMEIEINDLAFVSGLSTSKLFCILDNKSQDHITLFPNTLISGTTIATSIKCERQAVLDQHFKIGDQNEAMLLGSMTHDLFQWALQRKNFSLRDLEERARSNLTSIEYLEALYAVGSDEKEMLQKIREYFAPIQEWYTNYVDSSMGKQIEFKTGKLINEKDVNVFLHVDEIIDIEENIWAPVYGLKGKIDVNVNVTVHRNPKRKSLEAYKLPLEVKTGKMFSKLGSVEHRAQVAVYTLLMSEKYDHSIDTGLLYYMKANHMVGVPRVEQEKKAILIKRNNIARKLTLERNHPTLPDLLRNPRQCKRCYRNSTCMLCYKALDQGEAQTSGMDELFLDLTSHLCEDDIIYFKKWYELCMLESSFGILKYKERFLWSTSSKEREKQGLCFAHMVLFNKDATSDRKIHYKFKRHSSHFNKAVPLHTIPLTVGDRVIISQEDSRVFNITTGYIVGVSSDDVTVSVHHPIVLKSSTSMPLYRLDKDETLLNYTTQLTNLSMLFSKDLNRDAKLRKLIIHCVPPNFSNVKANDLAATHQVELKRSHHSYKASQTESLNSIYANLNESQKLAIEKCLVADDYVMILGMPGAGKSTTTACLVRALVSLGKSVLLTSYTHSAVDTILIKLLEVNFQKFLRLGQTSRIHSKILPFSSYECTKDFTTANQLRDFYNSQTVVATTCLGIQHPIFKHKSFDYCIVDEASQITQPVCIGPIRYANTFILVGDHNQLPPLVQCEEARTKGLDVSLFRSLSEQHPEAVVTLDRQYRMNRAIMTLTNELVYRNEMKCGNQAVADALLHLPFYASINDGVHRSQLLEIINPQMPVVFLDTDDACLTETKNKLHIVNYGEAQLVKYIVDILYKSGMNSRSIGIISPYRHQLNVIQQELTSLVSSTLPNSIEVDTIDKYQGKDKPCIIVSLVRSNNEKEVGNLLQDWRRINVAITRAKHKLILIGSRKTVVLSETFQKLLSIIDQNCWCISWKGNYQD